MLIYLFPNILCKGIHILVTQMMRVNRARNHIKLRLSCLHTSNKSINKKQVMPVLIEQIHSLMESRLRLLNHGRG